MATAAEAPAPATEVEPEGLYEVVGGKIVEKPPMGVYEAEIASIIARLMGNFALSNHLGRAVAEMLFRIDPERPLDRRPDVAFVSHERWALERRAPRTAAWEVVPDLAVEVLSPGNRTVDDGQKIEDYFRAGVRTVWLVYPNVAKTYVYTSPTSVSILDLGGTLDGGPVLPGFRLPLITLFGEGPA